ncbi:tape-measure protein [Streptomyces sp. NPDC102467]|uniref:tape-measure protein n=1 Tax=Streptomyces sp. NPDC102467 TaxID=3366179 RepID=UPI00380D342C
MSSTTLVDPFKGAMPTLRSLRTRGGQAQSGLRSFTQRVKSAATGLGRMRSPIGQGATAVQRVRTGADTAARSVTRTARTATRTATTLKSAAARGRSAGGTLRKLGTGLGSVFAIVAALIDASGVFGTLLDTFGTAMTIGAGVMLLINILTRANPIGFVTGLLLPVASWLLDIAMNSETGQRLMEQLAKLVLKYVEGYLAVLTPILKAIAQGVSTYVTAWLTIATGVLTALTTLVRGGFTVMQALTSGDTRALRAGAASVWRGFKDAVRPLLNWISKDIPKGFGRIKDATSHALGAMGKFVTTGAQTVAGVIKGPFQGLVAFANWVIDGLNKLSFNFFGKKFGVHLSKIPMLAQGGIAVPGAHRTGRVLALTALERQRALALRGRARATAQQPHRIEAFHESRAAGAHGTAQDLLFLAAAHTRT